tara:strand:- start:94427 stop:94735 length:309 start_codon:yes stop_codon:yes gene_type:complete
MTDISSPKLLYVKAGLFVLCGAMAAGLIPVDSPSLRTAALLGLSIWCFARAYYFAFYVIEHYVDGDYRYAGLGDFFLWSWQRFRKRNSATESNVETVSNSEG